MKNISGLLFVLLAAVAPLLTSAQGGDKDSVQGYLVLITNFIGDTLLPFLFAIALLFFLVNVGRFFIAGGSDAESQEKAKTLALYGIGAFVFLVSIWGIVNMFVNAFEIDDDEAKCPDYLQDWCGSSGNYGSSGGGYQRFDSYYGDFSNESDTITIEEFENAHQTQNAPEYDNNGNLLDHSDSEGTPDEEIVDEPAEETDVHNDEESAPVNIGDTAPSNRSNCATSPSGIETCDLMQ